MKLNIGRELELWITSFILSIGIVLLLGCLAIIFWHVWTSFEDKSIPIFSILAIVSTTIIVRNFLKDVV